MKGEARYAPRGKSPTKQLYIPTSTTTSLKNTTKTQPMSPMTNLLLRYVKCAYGLIHLSSAQPYQSL